MDYRYFTYHGISFYGTTGSTIRDNVVVDINQNDPWSLRIRINPHKDGRTCSNCLVENNIALSFAIDAGGKNITLYDNTTLDKATYSATMDSMFEDPARCDFCVKDPALKQLPGHTY